MLQKQWSFEHAAEAYVCLPKSVPDCPSCPQLTRASSGCHCLQKWPHSGDVKEVAQIFTQYATQLIRVSDLDTVSEPYNLLQKKVVRYEHGTWRKKLTDWTLLSVLGYKRKGRSKHQTLTAKEAKKKIEDAAPGQKLVQKLQAWMTACAADLPLRKYRELADAKAIAWNWWLDKIMDHTRTVSHNDGVAAAANNLVTCPLTCPLTVNASRWITL